MTEKQIERLFNVLVANIHTTEGTLSYERITEGLISLSNCIYNYDDETESLWYMGESSYETLDSLIVGAFWHYTEWHAGQNSLSYAALSALGGVFSPGMSMPEEDNQTYQLLDEMARADQEVNNAAS